MKFVWTAVLAGACAMSGLANAAEKGGESVLDHKVKSIAGKEVDLKDYEGKVLLVVNVASKCGYTPQYKQLQAVQTKYEGKGLEVLGFPSNQFGGQEPGSDEEIATFCRKNYQVSFDMFHKVDVNGEAADPFFKDLKTQADPSGDVKWNFEKFLIGRDGKVVARFESKVKPDSPEVTKAIEAELAKDAAKK